jgi:hypothetical protein
VLRELFFILGLVNNAFLIFIFLIRKKHLKLLEKVGWVYLLLAIPGVYAIFLSLIEGVTVQYTIFLSIFIAFLVIEGLYDFILKIKWRANWKLMIPYLCLYYAMNYGFVVMVWKDFLIGGVIMLILFIIQIIANILTHERKTKLKNKN